MVAAVDLLANAMYTVSQRHMKRGKPMVKTLSAQEARSEFSSLLGQVRSKKDTVIVEEKGRPVIAMMPFDRYKALTKKRDRLFTVLGLVWAKNRNMPARQAFSDATQAVKHTRAARRSRDIMLRDAI